MGGTRHGRRVTMAEAAEILGVSVEAIRKRVQRETIKTDKGPDGRRYVYLSESYPKAEDEGMTSSPLVDALKDEIAHLRRESERKDAIIMSLSQSNAELSSTIRAIEAPAAEPQSPEERPESPGPTSDTPGQGEPLRGDPERSWWRRIFGG